MGEYSRLDPYLRSRYEDGIDSKIVIMGNSGVGKTSLLQRYTQNKFDPKNTTSTSGAFFVTKKVYVNGLKVRLQLWDTAGQERFRSMAPMYYRGANAALLLYDITNVSTFNDIRGWLEELKRNCPPELIIYIVGAKADLSRSRAVTPDLARLSLHNWFPPPKPPPAPAPAPPPPSTLSYIRPRFTSFPGLRSPPITTSPVTPETPAYLDLPPNRSSALQRNKTVAQSRPRTGGGSAGSSSIARANSMATSRTPQSSRFSLYGHSSGSSWLDSGETSSNSINEDDEDALEFESEEQEWGLSKGMELFEVSAKDDTGIDNLFQNLISAIIVKKDIIEKENEMKKRDSVFLSSINSPAWAAQADEEEARAAATKPSGSWNCYRDHATAEAVVLRFISDFHKPFSPPSNRVTQFVSYFSISLSHSAVPGFSLVSFYSITVFFPHHAPSRFHFRFANIANVST
ncbi:hypothetical protein H0H93_000284 [Arthromyces matolae]|nr:hypothetical protein H0H93_000284 [Arthromyces matolae]